MKKFYILFLLCVLHLPVSLQAFNYLEEDLRDHVKMYIRKHHLQVQVKADGSAHVTEYIWFYNNHLKHIGPLKRAIFGYGRDFDESLFRVCSVSDLRIWYNGLEQHPETNLTRRSFEVLLTSVEGEEVINPGVRFFKIEYDITRLVDDRGDDYLLYLVQPYNQFRLFTDTLLYEISFPQPLNQDDLLDVHGSQGYKETAFASEVKWKLRDGKLYIQNYQRLTYLEGFTGVVAFKKSVIEGRTFLHVINDFFLDLNLRGTYLLWMLIITGIYVVVWVRTRHRFSLSPAAITGPPAGISPAAAAYLDQGAYSFRAFAAAIAAIVNKKAYRMQPMGGAFRLEENPGPKTGLSGDEKALATDHKGRFWDRIAFLRQTSKNSFVEARHEKYLEKQYGSMVKKRTVFWAVTTIIYWLGLLGISWFFYGAQMLGEFGFTSLEIMFMVILPVIFIWHALNRKNWLFFGAAVVMLALGLTVMIHMEFDYGRMLVIPLFLVSLVSHGAFILLLPGLSKTGAEKLAAVRAWKQKLKKDLENPQVRDEGDHEPWMIAFGLKQAQGGLRNAYSGGLEWMEMIQRQLNRWRRF